VANSQAALAFFFMASRCETLQRQKRRAVRPAKRRSDHATGAAKNRPANAVGLNSRERFFAGESNNYKNTAREPRSNSQRKNVTAPAKPVCLPRFRRAARKRLTERTRRRRAKNSNAGARPVAVGGRVERKAARRGI